ncbi:MAG: hypothetical protein ACLQVD_03700 [Capsulimonadaceae bacterium]
MPHKKFRTLIATVGENPLPVALGAREFAGEQVFLLHSRETEDAARQTKGVLTGLNTTLFLLDDPHSPDCVERNVRKCLEDDPDAGLNYTGGTKVMSSFALLVLQKVAGSVRNAFYLDESSRTFRFGDGDPDPMTADVTLAELCDLHGVALQQKKSANFEHNKEDIMSLWENAQLKGQRVHVPRQLVDTKDREQFEFLFGNGAMNVGQEWTAAFGLLSEATRAKWESKIPRSVNQFINFGWPDLIRFMGGTWFEYLLTKRIYNLAEKGDDEDVFAAPPAAAFISHDSCYSGQHFRQDFEADFLTWRNHRLRYISITTDGRKKWCKGKVFEAIHRAKQIGGGLARSMTVCLADRNACGEITKSIDSEQQHSICGMADVQDWMDGRTGTLRSFLTD